jgi:hypothetical protein
MSATAPTGSMTTPEPPGPLPPKGAVEDARELAVASLKRKRKLAEDAFAYVAVNGVLWLIWALTDRSVDGGMPWPAWVSLIWGFLLALDAWRALGRWPRSLHAAITEEAIERESRRVRGA